MKFVFSGDVLCDLVYALIKVFSVSIIPTASPFLGFDPIHVVIVLSCTFLVEHCVYCFKIEEFLVS